MSYHSYGRPFGRPNQNHAFAGSRRSSGGRANFHSGTIDHNRYIQKATPGAAQAVFTATHHFADFALDERLKQNILKRGFQTPTPIQDEAIQPALDGYDVIGLADTGTGKTIAFMLPILQHILKSQGASRALIMAPTRELAGQIYDETVKLTPNLPIRAALFVGGSSFFHQRQSLRNQPQILIGTPGRLKDLVDQGLIDLRPVNLLVLDEADRMLDMGFIKPITELISKLSPTRQSFCFSATLTSDIRRLVDQLLTDPVTISVRATTTNTHIEQDVIRAGSKEDKVSVLENLLRQPEFEKVLVFSQTKHGTQRLADTLTKRGIAAETIHGNKSQPQRERALRAFKTNVVRVLVATDVAARGLDIPNVSHVINFDEPNTYEDYIHRIGRTGRGSKLGNALTFID